MFFSQLMQVPELGLHARVLSPPVEDLCEGVFLAKPLLRLVDDTSGFYEIMC